MDGEQDGAQAQGEAVKGQQGEPQDAGQPETQRQGQHQASTVGADGADYSAVLKAKDARIAELEGKIAEAAKTSEAAEALNAEIAALKRQMADERVEFALKGAGARNLKAAKALLDDYDGDVDALKAGEPWMFAQVDGTSQSSSQASGATGLEPAGVAGGGDSSYMKRWERIAGLSEDKEG